ALISAPRARFVFSGARLLVGGDLVRHRDVVRVAARRRSHWVLWRRSRSAARVCRRPVGRPMSQPRARTAGVAHPSPHAHPLHFVEYGEGTPVLALHGWGPDHRLMTGCLEPVFANRPGFRRIYPDLPG